MKGKKINEEKRMKGERKKKGTHLTSKHVKSY